MRLFSFTFALFSPLATIGIISNLFPSSYAACMSQARAVHGYSIEHHYSSGLWRKDDLRCAASN